MEGREGEDGMHKESTLWIPYMGLDSARERKARLGSTHNSVRVCVRMCECTIRCRICVGKVDGEVHLRLLEVH